MNIGMITQGAVRFQPVRQALLKQGNRCQSYAFFSTFMASAATMLFDCVVLNWDVSGKDTPEVVRLLRNKLPGTVRVVVVNVPSTVQFSTHDQYVEVLHGPMSSRELVDYLANASVQSIATRRPARLPRHTVALLGAA